MVGEIGFADNRASYVYQGRSGPDSRTSAGGGSDADSSGFSASGSELPSSAQAVATSSESNSDSQDRRSREDDSRSREDDSVSRDRNHGAEEARASKAAPSTTETSRKLRDVLIKIFKEVGYTDPQAEIKANKIVGHAEAQITKAINEVTQQLLDDGSSESEAAYQIRLEDIELAIQGAEAGAGFNNESIKLAIEANDKARSYESEEFRVDIQTYTGIDSEAIDFRSNPHIDDAVETHEPGVYKIEVNLDIELTSSVAQDHADEVARDAARQADSASLEAQRNAQQAQQHAPLLDVVA